ncbi:MAG TPA: ATP-binding protein [Polyangiaceae bacterium]
MNQPIPAIKSGAAIQSLRHSGYDIAAALGEPIDNSLEANANRIEVRLEERAEKKKRHVNRILIVDDGDGMDADTLHRCLQLGFSTRYMKTNTIGKFGVGAKLAALSFAQRIDVWSRRRKEDPWLHVYLDLEEKHETTTGEGEVTIAPPSRFEPPAEVADMLRGGKGTAVVWSKIDKLEEGRQASDANALRVHVEKELSRIFRYFVHGGREIIVNGTPLMPHDPLFKMDRTWGDHVLSQGSDDGDEKKAGRHFVPALIISSDEEIPCGDGRAFLTVTLYPREVVRKRGKGGDKLARELRVPENTGSISFVRLDREISYTNVPRMLPNGVQDMDRFIGIEVKFTPVLDGYFGVRNVKRGVEPDGELRTAIRKLLEKYIETAREKIHEIWGQREKQDRDHEGEVAPVLEAVKDADRTMPTTRVEPSAPEEVERQLETLAADVGKTEPTEKERYKQHVKEQPFHIEAVDFPGSNFVTIDHLGRGQPTIIRLNTRHRFYRELWEPILSFARQMPGEVEQEEALRTARRTIEALSLLVVAYAKAESMDDAPREKYGDLRQFWGQFLDTLMGKVTNVL